MNEKTREEKYNSLGAVLLKYVTLLGFGAVFGMSISHNLKTDLEIKIEQALNFDTVYLQKDKDKLDYYIKVTEEQSDNTDSKLCDYNNDGWYSKTEVEAHCDYNRRDSLSEEKPYVPVSNQNNLGGKIK